ncbi:MAG: hypothetical protein IPP17_10005 [Bacteroidetes bacterium]|nr:hypothetical protein [Bacteroidota bacterium]
MTEFQLQPPIENIVTEAKMASFRRLGGTVFAIGGFFQGLSTLLISLGILTRNYVYITASFYGEDLTWNGLWTELKSESALLIALGSTAVLLIGPSFGMGRWAGRKIGLKKLRYGWVGLITAIILSVFASICMCFIACMLDDELAKDFWHDGTMILSLFTAMYLLPGIATGIVSGLVVRQRIRSKLQKTLTDTGASTPSGICPQR